MANDTSLRPSYYDDPTAVKLVNQSDSFKRAVTLSLDQNTNQGGKLEFISLYKGMKGKGEGGFLCIIIQIPVNSSNTSLLFLSNLFKLIKKCSVLFCHQQIKFFMPSIYFNHCIISLTLKITLLRRIIFSYQIDVEHS